MSKLEISVIIPTHLRSESLDRALASLRHQDLDRSSFEVLVISNLDDRRVKFHAVAARETGIDVRHFVVGRVGVNRARNLGLVNARGKVLFFLDDDCRLLRRDHLSILIERFRDEADIDLRGGFYRDSLEASPTARSYNAIVNAWLRGRSAGKGPMVGGNFSVRAPRIGAARFDEAITYGGSEVSFQETLVRDGVVAKLDLDMDVEHDCELTSYAFLRKAWLQGRRFRQDPEASVVRSIFSLASGEVGTAENVRRIAVGAIYGGVSRAGWVSAKVASVLDDGHHLVDQTTPRGPTELR